MCVADRPVDRHAALKARHRRAILDAAAPLMDDVGIGGFSVEELAQRADVSRRTIFNHFPSLSDVEITVCSERFDEAMGVFAASSVGRRHAEGGSVFDDVAEALRSMDLISPMGYLLRVLTPESLVSRQIAVMFSLAVKSMSQRLSADLKGRHPAADHLAVDLLVASLMAGIPVLADAWAQATGGIDDADSRRVFADLLERFICAMGEGFSSNAVFDRTS